MGATLVRGNDIAVEVSTSVTTTDKLSSVVVVEGRYSHLQNLSPARYCPSGYDVESSQLVSTGNGMGRLTVNGIKYSNSSVSGTVKRTTYRVDMAECQYDLEDHPKIADGGGRHEVLLWLATDEDTRVQGNTYKYLDAAGVEQTVSNAWAIKFCKAYMAGIKTFMRYYPVIEKVSIYDCPPGMNRSGCSFSGGSPSFSAGIGTYSSPPLTLNGYPQTNWFKSRDSWVEASDKTWSRTEQWTYTPEGSSSDHAWIYDSDT